MPSVAEPDACKLAWNGACHIRLVLGAYAEPRNTTVSLLPLYHLLRLRKTIYPIHVCSSRDMSANNSSIDSFEKLLVQQIVQALRSRRQLL